MTSPVTEADRRDPRLTGPNWDALFSSVNGDWETPRYLFDSLDAEFGFERDVCALPHNAKCATFYSPEEDGLAQAWEGVCWMNPPYGRHIGKWVRKAWDESKRAETTVVCLLPARTDTTWFHRYCLKGEVRFLRGRVKFKGAANGAPFPSMVVIFRGGHK